MPSTTDFAVKPIDYVGLNPRLLVGEGDNVTAGTILFVDKNNPDARFASPVDGKVKAIVRGEKRALLAVVVERTDDAAQQPLCSPERLAAMNRDEMVDTMVEHGLWTLLRQRPFGIIPQRDSHPKAVFISAFDSSPLPVDYAFMLDNDDFQKGIDILASVGAKVHLGLSAKNDNAFLENIKNAEIHHFDGPHPAGLTGTHIAFVDPINKGETVWTVNAQDVATIGHFFRTGLYKPERTVAFCGTLVEKPQYYRTTAGASISALAAMVKPQNGHAPRFISGDVLSGLSIAADGFMSAQCDKISVLPEGDYYDFMGWLRPNFRKFSFSRTFLSGFLSKFKCKNSKFTFDTGRHGDHRPLFVTGEFEKLVPLNIYPMQLIKACIVGDIELMEELGIYEVEPEDLALCEFADTSKTEIQAIVRNALEKIRKED